MDRRRNQLHKFLGQKKYSLLPSLQQFSPGSELPRGCGGSFGRLEMFLEVHARAQQLKRLRKIRREREITYLFGVQ
jgi:hypothetical protein